MLLCFAGLCCLGGGLCYACFSATATPSDCATKLIRERRGGGNWYCTDLLNIIPSPVAAIDSVVDTGPPVVFGYFFLLFADCLMC